MRRRSPQKLADQGRMVDVEVLLKDLGPRTTTTAPAALNYQRFDDGSLHMMPFEFQLEFFWYNTALFEQAGVEVPETLDDFPAMCTALRDAGITPIALDGQDQWPLERYMAYHPFRHRRTRVRPGAQEGRGEVRRPRRRAAVEWLYDLGQAGCFQEGFSSTGYADAQAPVHLGQGRDLQHRHLGARQPRHGRRSTRRCATTSTTSPCRRSTAPSPTTNEYVTPSGIGMAVNAQDLRPAGARLPHVRPRALPGDVRRHRRALADHERRDDDPRERDAALPARPSKQADEVGDDDRDAVGHPARPHHRTPACSRS